VTEEESKLRGRVAKLITDEELAINLGSANGVERGMIFDVLSKETEDIYDPVTMKKLGSIDRVKTRVRVTDVGNNLALAKVTTPRGNVISSAAQVMLGQSGQSTRMTPDIWPEGVRIGDPVRLVPRLPEYSPDTA
jgi:hypothetical protein